MKERVEEREGGEKNWIPFYCLFTKIESLESFSSWGVGGEAREERSGREWR